jgi:hypothetical protein
MTDYTPTTEHVRAQYARQENYDDYYKGDIFLTSDGQISAAQFDRWLESVKAEARNEVLNREWITTPDELLQHVIAGRESERERIVRQLENIATNVIKSGNEYWDGYVRALEDVRLNNWPID